MLCFHHYNLVLMQSQSNSKWAKVDHKVVGIKENHVTSSSNHMHIFYHNYTLSLSKYPHCIDHNSSQLTLTWKMASNDRVFLVTYMNNNDSHTKDSTISTLHPPNHPRCQVLKAHTSLVQCCKKGLWKSQLDLHFGW